MQQAADMLLKNDNILILAHASPDGDTLGSSYALCQALQILGKNARVQCQDEIPDCYRFIVDGVKEMEFEPEFYVTVDVAALELLGTPEYYNELRGKINLSIDHHVTNTGYADFTCIEDGDIAAAAAETVLQIIRMMETPIDREIAEGIYVGLATDTGCFRYANTTSRTMRMAADMIDCKIDLKFINKTIFETRTKTYHALETMALHEMSITDDGEIAILVVTREMFEKSGSKESEFHPLKSIPRQIEGVKVGITMRESDKDTYRVAIRTNDGINASHIAAHFGGGGHPGAAGCTVHGKAKDITDEFIRVIREEMVRQGK